MSMLLIDELKNILGDVNLEENKDLHKFIEMCEEIRENLTYRIIQIESSDQEKDKICDDLIQIVQDRQANDNKKDT